MSPQLEGTAEPKRRHRVVIIGSGFGGLNAAKKLKRADVDIKLIARTTHHLFQPLLYQVATGIISEGEIAPLTRVVLRKQRNVQVLLGKVTHIDLANQSVVSELLGHSYETPYDTLIVAAGAGQSYFGNDHFAEFAPGMKSIDDALELRGRILSAFEQAERSNDPERRKKLLTFTVVGAGPTGVEMAGTLAEIAKHTLAGEFRHIDPSSAQVLLVEGGARVLQAMPENLSQKALEQLERLGVEVRLNARVTAIDATGLEVQSGGGADGAAVTSYRIDSSCVVWAAGVAASPLGRMLGSATGVECDRAGRIKVEPDLSLAGYPEISVVGDLAAAMSHAPGKAPKPVPGVSPGAKQMGSAAATNILRRMAGEPTVPFRYADYGNLATIGRNSAVVDLGTPLGPLRFSGRLAWLFWLFAHAYFLIGFRNRIVVMMDWASAYWSFRRNARVVADVQGKSES